MALSEAGGEEMPGSLEGEPPTTLTMTWGGVEEPALASTSKLEVSSSAVPLEVKTR